MCTHRLFIRFTLVIQTVVLISLVSAQPQLVRRIGQYLLPSFSPFERNLVVVGNYAYITGESTGLTVLNVVNPESIFFAGSIGNMGNTRGLAILNQYAYVTTPDSGLYVIDILNADSLSIVSYLPLYGAARFTVVGNNAYIATINYDTLTMGLSIVNISNPFNPFLTGFCATQQPNGIAIQNGYAYLASWPGIVVVDVSDPANPDTIGSAAIAYPDGIAVNGNYAYVATDSGLCVVDITVPSRPTPASHYYSNNLGVWTTDVAFNKNLAFLTQWNIGLRVLDINNPNSPTLVGENDLPMQNNWMHSVFVNDSWAYTAEARYLGIFDYSNLLSIPESSHATLPTTFSLADPYPNPFNASTLIKFELPQMTRVKVQVFDNLGRVVNTLANENLNTGEHRLHWNATGNASGSYFIHMTLPGEIATKKVELVK